MEHDVPKDIEVHKKSSLIQLTFTCLRLTLETLEKGVKYVQI